MVSYVARAHILRAGRPTLLFFWFFVSLRGTGLSLCLFLLRRTTGADLGEVAGTEEVGVATIRHLSDRLAPGVLREEVLETLALGGSHLGGLFDGVRSSQVPVVVFLAVAGL